MPIHCFASDDSLGQKSDYRPLAVVPRILTSSLNTATREAPSAPVGAVEEQLRGRTRQTLVRTTFSSRNA